MSSSKKGAKEKAAAAEAPASPSPSAAGTDAAASPTAAAATKQLSLEQLLKETGTDLRSGLPNEAAVEASRARYGSNRLPEHKSKGFLSHLLETFEDFTLQVLVASAVVSVIFGLFISKETADIVQGGAIVLAVVLVSGVNSFQNWSKEKEFQALASIKKDRPVQVVRGGREQRVSVYSVVVGDLVKLSPGDAIPCDGLLVEGEDIEVDQSKMTGESEPVLKSAGAGGDRRMLGGCVLLESTGSMLVTAVGEQTEIGSALHTMESEEAEDTPLEQRLEELAEQIGKVGTAAGGLTFLVLTAFFLQQHWGSGVHWLSWPWQDVVSFFIVGVTILVVAIPEGLPLSVTISLAYSMRKMMKDNNLVRQLQACETMGSCTVLCSDKTGTLTEK